MILGRLVRGIGAGIGAATEAYDSRQKKKAAEQAGEGLSGDGTAHHPDDDLNHSDLEDDEAEWALDDAQQELQPPTYEEVVRDAPFTDAEVASRLAATHNLKSGGRPLKPLPCPVVVPQRRPKEANRGFVLAYAPLLNECVGLDQKTFIDFLEAFNKSCKANPAFDVINLAATAGRFTPSAIAHLVSISVRTAAKAGSELQSRHGRNTFLDEMNAGLFEPLGLHAMIVAFSPDKREPRVRMNLLSRLPVHSYVQNSSVGQSASMVSRGEAALPECAPLFYPGLDDAVDGQAQLSDAKQHAVHGYRDHLADYLDRRAQAEFAAQHPRSALSVPQTQGSQTFASRYADPNHPANSGTILGLITGGTFDPRARRRGRRAQRRARRRGYELTPEEIHDAEMGRMNSSRVGGVVGRVRGRERRSFTGRTLQKDVLYLMIANIPQDAESSFVQV